MDEQGQRERFATCSGTLIFIENSLMYLTAGHVLKKLDELRQSRKAQIGETSLADTWGSKRITDVPIPFDLGNAEFFT